MLHDCPYPLKITMLAFCRWLLAQCPGYYKYATPLKLHHVYVPFRLPLNLYACTPLADKKK
jgi:hypothetical protein